MSTPSDFQIFQSMGIMRTFDPFLHHNQVLPLLDIATKSLCQNEAFFEAYLSEHCLPAQLCQPLLNSMLLHCDPKTISDVFIETILKMWPWESLDLSRCSISPCKPLDQLNSYWSLLESLMMTKSDWIFRLLKIFFALYESNEMANSRLRVLDFRGRMLPCHVFHFLVNQVYLKNLVVQQRSILNFVKLAKDKLKINEEQAEAFGNLQEYDEYTVPDRKFTFIFDCSIDSSDMFSLLMLALKSCQSNSSAFSLKIDQMMFNLNAEYWHELQAMLDVEQNTFSGLFLINPDILSALPNHMLTGCKSFSIVLHPAQSVRHDILQAQLQNVSELTLRGTGVSGRLNALITDSMRNRINCLDLAMCQLDAIDLIRLSSVFSFPQLTELVLNGNDLSRNANSISLMLRKLRQNLRILALSRCQLSDAHADQIFREVSNLASAEWVDLSFNEFSLEVVDRNKPVLLSSSSSTGTKPLYVWLKGALNDVSHNETTMELLSDVHGRRVYLNA